MAFAMKGGGGLYHILHILKAIVPADNLSCQKTIFEHPTRRQIFANTVGRICKLNLTLLLMYLPFSNWND